MKNNTEKKKAIPKISVLIFLLILGVAFARYIKQVNGTANANLAKYVLKVNGSGTQNFVIDLGQTRTGTQEAEVAENYIGPRYIWNVYFSN